MSETKSYARKAERLNISLSKLLYKELKEMAEREDRTLRSLVEEAIRQFLKREKK
jgi:metal-responsive CopG/Arc/MetJ family transcriptional regulator